MGKPELGSHQLGEDEGAAGGRVTPVTRPSGARSAGDGRVTGVSRPGTRRPEPQLYSRIDSDYRKSHYVYNVLRPTFWCSFLFLVSVGFRLVVG